MPARLGACTRPAAPQAIHRASPTASIRSRRRRRPRRQRRGRAADADLLRLHRPARLDRADDLDRLRPGGGATIKSSTTFRFSSPDSDLRGFECRLDGAAFGALHLAEAATAASPTAPTPSPSGPSTAPATSRPRRRRRSFYVYTGPPDSTRPTATIDSGPSGNVPTSSVTFDLLLDGERPARAASAGSTASPYAACQSPKHYPGLADGSHSFAVRAVDLAGNIETPAASRAFTVDTRSPDHHDRLRPGRGRDRSSATSTSASARPTPTCAPSVPARLRRLFELHPAQAIHRPRRRQAHLHRRRRRPRRQRRGRPADADLLRLHRPARLDRADDLDRLGAGRGRDGPGRSGRLRLLLRGPGRARLRVQAGRGPVRRLRLAGAPGALADGAHTFSVRAVDHAGNVEGSPPVRGFYVYTGPPDSTAPDDHDRLRPGRGRDDRRARTRASSSPRPTPTCAASSATSTARRSARARRRTGSPGSTDGAHTFTVRATDQAGNVEADPPTPQLLRLHRPPDSTAPTTRSTPARPRARPSRARTRASSSPRPTRRARLRVRSRRRRVRPVRVAARALGMTDGAHTFTVRATDQAGNVEAAPPTPELLRLHRPARLDRPDDLDRLGPGRGRRRSTGDQASFEFSSRGHGRPRLRVRPRRRRVRPVRVAARALRDLTDGAHTFTVRATDQAGNVEAAPPTRSFYVYTGPPDSTAPTTPIDSGPAEGETVQGAQASFEFSSPDPDVRGFECDLDGEGFGPLRVAARALRDDRRRPHVHRPRDRPGRQRRGRPAEPELHRRRRAAVAPRGQIGQVGSPRPVQPRRRRQGLRAPASNNPGVEPEAIVS